MPKSVALADSQTDSARGTIPRPHDGNKAGAPPQRRRAIVIGASTGGLQALPIVLNGLRTEIQHVPVLLVLHIPFEFTDMIAGHIAKATALPIRTARHGEEVGNGHVYVSPGNLHLAVARVGRLAITVLSDAPPENFCKPSVDVLFRTAAHAYGAETIGIVLTGMGSDGLSGSRAIVEAGGVVIAQDAASSTVWGMPRSVAEQGLAHAVLALESIGPAVCRLLRQAPSHERQP